MISREIKEIKDFEGYFVSNYGQIYTTKKNGGYKTNIRELKIKEDKDGYLEVGIYKNKKRFFRRVHRLVAEAFLENPNHYPQINHIDGDTKNNNVSNLEWCTCRDNLIHSFKVLNRNPTIISKRLKLTNKLTNEVLYFNSEKDCAFYLNMSYEHLSKLLTGYHDISKWRKGHIYKVEFCDIEDVTTIRKE